MPAFNSASSSAASQPQSDTNILPFRPRRGYRLIEVGPCTCGSTGRYHSLSCPSVRVGPENRIVPWCPWPVCRGRGADQRDCGDCQGADWRPREVMREARRQGVLRPLY